MDDKRFNLIFGIFLVSLIIVLIFLYVVIRDKGTACVVDPLTYAMETTPEINSISVSFEDPSLLPIYQTKEGRTYINYTPQEQTYSFPENISLGI
jgi:hypothetical protein